MQTTTETRQGTFGEIPFKAKLEIIEPGDIVAGVRLELGYQGVTLEFPDRKRPDGEYPPYVSWQIPLRSPDLIDKRLRIIFPDNVPPQVLEGATKIINKFAESLT